MLAIKWVQKSNGTWTLPNTLSSGRNANSTYKIMTIIIIIIIITFIIGQGNESPVGSKT